ncbi:MAG: HAMP domain-containing histidine kinase [Actinobacteria bacterium]|nr:HAMP domain-containing histidine kinase [Actinomycetota bacterium]
MVAGAAGAAVTRDDDPRRRLDAVDVVWVVFVLVMLAQMWNDLHNLTWPYHLIWVSLGLLYGFRMWPPRVFAPLIGLLAVLTSANFLVAYVRGYTSLDELTEIPLMPLLVGIGAMHAWRRSQMQRRVEELAALESSRLDRQREFLRDSSHAIRTPVTIARGHVDLLRMTTTDAEAQEDLDVVLHQLDRLSHLAGRLLSIEQLETTRMLDRVPIEVGGFLEAVGRRWSVSAARTWVVDAPPVGVVRADEHRLEEAVDALVENALRFTTGGGVVRLSCRRDGDAVVVEVGDDGPGIPEADREAVFDRFFHRHPQGEEPGTGLGLALVAAVAAAHGGTATAGAAPEGGALLSLRIPLAATQPGTAPSAPQQTVTEPTVGATVAATGVTQGAGVRGAP